MPNAEEIRTAANQLIKAKDYSRARELLTETNYENDRYIASCLGFIHSRRDSKEYDLVKAIRYYEVAAAEGDAYSLYALAGIFSERGDTEQALHWYKQGSDAGNASCSYALYRKLRLRNEIDASEQYLLRAIKQENPAAIQELAIRYIKGRFGVLGIFRGAAMYVRNIPGLVRYTKENIS